MNRYIKAMQIGLAHEKDGISYHELLTKLETMLGEKMDSGAEKTFVVWFVENFTADNRKGNNQTILGNFNKYINIRNAKEDKGKLEHSEYLMVKKLLSKRHWLDGATAKQYLDYQELQDSRKAAIQAKKQSNVSIAIAIFALLVSTGFGIISLSNSPKPPYDVRVIDDISRTRQLEQDNSELREKLYKTELQIKVYEADSI